ncbi:MAG TPA: TonB-dependent receptor, partial [Phenylobacterium sp.]
PLIQDQPFAKDITAELAYRYSDYSNAGTTNTYKVSGDWTIVDGIRFRGGYNRAVRAPNVVELFSPLNVINDGTQDPCAGLKAGNPLVQRCASLFNLTTAQVLALEPDPANQYNGQTGGNPNLRPETADTYTFGVVWQPAFVPGLNVSVDWYDIKIKDLITAYGGNLILNTCLDGTHPEFCAQVHRDAIGSIKSIQGFVMDGEVNAVGQSTSGVDITAGYHTSLDTFGIHDMGSISANFVGSWLDKLETTILKGSSPIDCAGFYGTICSTMGSPGNPNTGNPKWRHKLRLTWNTPFEMGWFGGLGLSAQWRYFSSVDEDASSSQAGLKGKVTATDAHLRATSYLDVLATFKVKDNYSFRVGVNNVLDQDPPLTGANSCPAGPCNQNVYAQTYDSMGRYVFVGLTADF